MVNWIGDGLIVGLLFLSKFFLRDLSDLSMLRDLA